MVWAGTVASAWLQVLYQYFIPFERVFKEVLVSFCAIGVGVGSFGSMVFVGKYLKV